MWMSAVMKCGQLTRMKSAPVAATIIRRQSEDLIATTEHIGAHLKCVYRCVADSDGGVQRGAEDERMRQGNISSRSILDRAYVCFHLSDVLLNSM
jgi:hypothetical protein